MNPLDLLAENVPHLQHSFDPAIVFGTSSFGMTQYIFWMIICFLITIAIVLGASKRLTLVPNNKFVNMVEYGYEFVRKDMGEGAIGHGYKKHIPFLATLFFFILISNFVGLIPGCKTPTGTISVTWALAIIYIKSIAPSGLPGPRVPVIWFFEFVSMLLRALTLAVRLYGNMFAGHMVLGVFALATSIFIGCAIQDANFIFALPPIGFMAFLIAMYALEVLVAFLQAYVFTILSAVYISLATSSH